ncbi:MAG: cytochrome c oxidase assembly protein [Micropruina sp.]
MAPTPLLLPLAVPLHADPENQPPPLTPESALTGWTPDPWVVAALVLMVGLYLWGVRRLAVRGIRWPVGRTIAWCVGGAGVIALALLSFLGTYDTVLFSVHMVQHILLSMIAPVMMAIGRRSPCCATWARWAASGWSPCCTRGRCGCSPGRRWARR